MLKKKKQKKTMSQLTRCLSNGNKINFIPRILTNRSFSSSESELVITKEKGLQTIRLNRPDQLNAISPTIYTGITKVLNESAKDDSVKITVLTGTGQYFSSGNDLKSTMKAAMVDPVKAANEGVETLNAFLDAFVDYPKILVSAVNGAAFGIMFTTLSLTDVVWASEKATFTSPFSKTAQSPEGTSTFTFPQIFGYSMANELLMFNRTLSAQEAYNAQFVSRVWPAENFLESVQGELTKLIEENSIQSMFVTKSLIRNEEAKANLKKIIRIENETLKQQWFSPDFAQAMMKFASRKKN